jgi:hypothetical protein
MLLPTMSDWPSAPKNGSLRHNQSSPLPVGEPRDPLADNGRQLLMPLPPPDKAARLVNRAALSRRHEGRVLINRDCSAIAGAQTTCADCAGSSGDFLPPSPPAEKATARKDQARQTGTGDGAGDTFSTHHELIG